MSHILNLGILAHVDAGKTSLTERLLFDHGAIGTLGSVDGGDTQTDSGELERRRGITIRSAVVAFSVGGLQVNLVDTPGHPDFIAEVERALSVLDGVVLVVSAVEGVQAQTRVLMRSLRRLRLPTLIFVNKIDRPGARHDALLTEIRARLTPSALPMAAPQTLGTADAHVVPRGPEFATEAVELLADHDDHLLRLAVDGVVPAAHELRGALARQTRAGLVHPLYFGSAMSGAGVAELAAGVRELLASDVSGTAAAQSSDGTPRGTVFAVERSATGEKVAYLRLFSGELRERRSVTFHRRDAGGAREEHTGRVGALEVLRAGSGFAVRRGTALGAGDVARVHGLPEVRVGDTLGEPDAARTAHFSPPVLESRVRPVHPGQESALHAALTRLADEDPLIRTRMVRGALSVRLYGEVQKEVIAERLHREFGIDAVFERAVPLFFEKPAGTGCALHEFNPRGPNDFWQTVGLRVEPAAPGSGTTFTREAERGLLPRAYHRAIEEAALAALHQGPHGRQVADCAVTLTHVGYVAPLTTPGDFRTLTPLVLGRALEEAKTVLFEPGYHVEVDTPEDALSAVTGRLMSLAADVDQPVHSGAGWLVPGRLPARNLHELAVSLPELTHGEGSVWYEPGEDRRVVDHKSRP